MNEKCLKGLSKFVNETKSYMIILYTDNEYMISLARISGLS